MTCWSCRQKSGWKIRVHMNELRRLHNDDLLRTMELTEASSTWFFDVKSAPCQGKDREQPKFGMGNRQWASFAVFKFSPFSIPPSGVERCHSVVAPAPLTRLLQIVRLTSLDHTLWTAFARLEPYNSRCSNSSIYHTECDSISKKHCRLRWLSCQTFEARDHCSILSWF